MNAYLLIILAAAVLFILFYAVQRQALTFGGYHYTDAPDASGRQANMKILIAGSLLFCIAAGLWLLIIPSSLPFNFMLNPPVRDDTEWVIGLSALAGIISHLSALSIIRKDSQKDFPPAHAWLFYFPVRIVFILSYEWFFRGVLFFSLMAVAGVWVSLVANTTLYWIAHMHGEKGERNGALIFGPVLCGLSYYYESCWPAAIVHLTLTLSHEIPLSVHAIRKINHPS